MKQLTNRPFKQILAPVTILPLLLPALLVGPVLAWPVEVQDSAAASCSRGAAPAVAAVNSKALLALSLAKRPNLC